MTCDDDSGPVPCQDLMLERIRYFTGRHMTARDFSDADAYHRSFRHLHNRVLHGSGVACGLEVERHWRPECRGDRVIVRCGLAIDCCGREIVVRKDVVVGRIPWHDRPKSVGPGDETVLLLCLKYAETRTEKVPVLYSSSACADRSMEYGRVREEYELEWHWVRRSELRKYGWDDVEGCAPPQETAENPAPNAEKPVQRAAQAPAPPARPVPAQAEPCPDDQDPCADDEKGCCLEPRCPPDHCLLLAIIWADGPEEMGKEESIDTTGRRSLAQAHEQLTHICWISWEHGGVVKASDLRRLRVRFDRPLLVESFPADHPGPRGINERTFTVQYGQQSAHTQTEDLDFVEFRQPPYLMNDRRTAVYEVAKPLTYRDHIIHVTLKCDFILDCRKQAVDGNHLGGRLPTGDRVPGGTFESWFRVVADDDYEAAIQKKPSAKEP